jgi:hypothetical protein
MDGINTASSRLDSTSLVLMFLIMRKEFAD